MIDWLNVQLMKLTLWFDSILFELDARRAEGLEEKRHRKFDGHNYNI